MYFKTGPTLSKRTCFSPKRQTLLIPLPSQPQQSNISFARQPLKSLNFVLYIYPKKLRILNVRNWSQPERHPELVSGSFLQITDY